MGEATLIREFAARPPRTELNTMKDLWRDYMWRYVNTGRGDPALPWTLKATNLDEALYRSVMSRGEDGKKWFHQGRVWDVNLVAYERLLGTRFYRNWIIEAGEGGQFWELYICLKKAAEQTNGIGVVTTYDVASRIGAWMGLEPEHLYFHAGVTDGLKAIGVTPARGTWCVDRGQLPKFFQDKNLEIVESFLCGYRSEIIRVMAPDSSSTPTRKSRSRAMRKATTSPTSTSATRSRNSRRRRTKRTN